MKNLAFSSWIFCLILTFVSAYDISDLNQDQVFPFSAATSGESFGTSVSNAGDINNDGYDDFIIGGPLKQVSGLDFGVAYVVYGREDLTSYDFDFSTTPLEPSTTGFTILGAHSTGKFGFSVSGAGDLDHDGYDDIIIGAPGDAFDKGVVYVIFGGEKSSLLDLNLQSNPLFSGSTGFTITGGMNGDQLGYSVSGAGDINNDGYDDIIIGAPGKSAQQGATYVIYGGERSDLMNIDLAVPLDYLTAGFQITGSASGTFFGYSVSTAGDLNLDGNNDILIGAPGDNFSKGVVYVFYGGPKPNLPGRDLSTNPLINSPGEGFTITGESAGDSLGISVSSVGDIDHDTYDDIIIGAPYKNGGQGAAYVIYGGGGDSLSLVDIHLSTPLIPGTNGFTITGASAGDLFGSSVSNATDINGDGYSDVIVGAYGKATNQGAVYVIYGGDRSDLGDIDLVLSLDPSAKGFSLSGIALTGRFGISVSNAGDVNNDGFGDVLIGANGENKAYLLTYSKNIR